MSKKRKFGLFLTFSDAKIRIISHIAKEFMLIQVNEVLRNTKWSYLSFTDE